MSKSLSHQRSACGICLPVVLAWLLASVSNAGAQDITYYIVDYPANEADGSSGTDAVSGTIVTDGTIGLLSAADIVGGTFSFTDAEGDVVSGSASVGGLLGLQATATSWSWSRRWLELLSQHHPAQLGVGANVVYVNDPGDPQLRGCVHQRHYGGSVSLRLRPRSDIRRLDRGEHRLGYRRCARTGFPRFYFPQCWCLA